MAGHRATRGAGSWSPSQLGCAVVCGAALLAGPTLRAENEPLARGQALYETLRYDEAYAAYRKAIEVPGNRPEQIADIYLHLGILAASMDRSAEAVDHFSRLICLNPQAQLAEGVSPKVRGPYLIAQEAQKKIAPFRLVHSPPPGLDASGSTALEFDLQLDSLGLASGVTVRYRQAGDPTFVQLAQPGGGRKRVVLRPTLSGGRDLEYFVEINDRFGGVLWEYASARSPVIVRARSQAAAAPAVASSAAADRSGSASDAWYQNTWVWVAAGAATAVLVAGSAAAAVVAATYRPSSVSFGPVESEVAP